jgi:F5/8 type C domain
MEYFRAQMWLVLLLLLVVLLTLFALSRSRVATWSQPERLLDYRSVGATAKQAGTWPGFLAENCLDNRDDTMCHSLDASDTSGAVWWEADLKSPQRVKRVEVTNRRDCCADRIAGAEIQFLDGQRRVLARQVFAGQQPTYSFSVRQPNVQYLRIELRSGSYINLLEVRTFVV